MIEEHAPAAAVERNKCHLLLPVPAVRIEHAVVLPFAELPMSHRQNISCVFAQKDILGQILDGFDSVTRLVLAADLAQSDWRHVVPIFVFLVDFSELTVFRSDSNQRIVNSARREVNVRANQCGFDIEKPKLFFHDLDYLLLLL